jgi:hypothetical protein
VPLAIDEEAGRTGHAACVGTRDVLGDSVGVLAAAQLVPEALDVEAELFRVALQVARLQFVLGGEQLVVHRPEGPLGARRLGGLGGHLGVEMDVVER